MNIYLKQLKIASCIGSDNGTGALQQIIGLINNNDADTVLNISFDEIKAVDVSFINASLIPIMNMYRKSKYFFLSDIENKDILLNLQYAGHFNNSLFLVKDSHGEIHWSGKDMTSNAMKILNYVYSNSEVSTSTLSNEFDISAPNASAKLKKLYDKGYIIGTKQDASTGGCEFIYQPIVAPNL